MTIIYSPARGIDRRDEMTDTGEYWHSYIYDFVVMRNILVEIIEMEKAPPQRRLKKIKKRLA